MLPNFYATPTFNATTHIDCFLDIETKQVVTKVAIRPIIRLPRKTWHNRFASSSRHFALPLLSFLIFIKVFWKTRPSVRLLVHHMHFSQNWLAYWRVIRWNCETSKRSRFFCAGYELKVLSEASVGFDNTCEDKSTSFGNWLFILILSIQPEILKKRQCLYTSSGSPRIPSLSISAKLCAKPLEVHLKDFAIT